MRYPYADQLVMIAELTIQPEKVDAFLEFTVPNLKMSRAAPGNVAFDILIDQSDPRRVLFYEVWESAEAQAAYMAWRVEAGDLTTLLGFLVAEPRFTALRQVAA